MESPGETEGGGLMKAKYLTGSEVIESFKKAFDGDFISEPYLKAFENGVKRTRYEQVFIRVKRERFVDAAKHLKGLEKNWPHHTVASGSDVGDEIEVLFHFELYSCSHGHGLPVTLGTRCPKDDPHIPTISDVFPAVTTTEREKQEFLGIAIDGIKDNRRMWLTHAVPVGVYPWRKDEYGPEKLVRKIHEDPSGGGDGTDVIADSNPFPPGGPPIVKKKGGDE